MAYLEDTLIKLIREAKAAELTYLDQIERAGIESRFEEAICNLEMALKEYTDHTPPSRSKAVRQYGVFARVVS